MDLPSVSQEPYVWAYHKRSNSSWFLKFWKTRNQQFWVNRHHWWGCWQAWGHDERLSSPCEERLGPWVCTLWIICNETLVFYLDNETYTHFGQVILYGPLCAILKYDVPPPFTLKVSDVVHNIFVFYLFHDFNLFGHNFYHLHSSTATSLVEFFIFLIATA